MSEERHERITDRQQPPCERYEIRLQGHLDCPLGRLVRRADRHATTATAPPSSEGPVADQAALHGLLQKLRDLGLPLISVTRRTRRFPRHPPPDPVTHRQPKETDMTTTVQIPAAKAAKGTPMTSTRKTALIAGACYLITFVSIPTLPSTAP